MFFSLKLSSRVFCEAERAKLLPDGTGVADGLYYSMDGSPDVR